MRKVKYQERTYVHFGSPRLLASSSGIARGYRYVYMRMDVIDIAISDHLIEKTRTSLLPTRRDDDDNILILKQRHKNYVDYVTNG